MSDTTNPWGTPDTPAFTRKLTWDTPAREQDDAADNTPNPTPHTDEASPDNSDAQEKATTLGDMFDSAPPPAPADNAEGGHAAAPEPPQPPQPQDADDPVTNLNDLFGGGPAPTPEPTPRPAPQPEPAPQPAPDAGNTWGADPATPLPIDPNATRTGHRKEFEELYPHVQRVLTVISGDHELSRKMENFQLTRDHDLDHASRAAMQELVTHKLATAELGIYDPSTLPRILDYAYDELIGIGPLGHLWRDDEITEILVFDYDHIVIERAGELYRADAAFRDRDHTTDIARNLAQRTSQRTLTLANPLVTAQMPGARVQFAIGPIVATGLSIAIRKFKPLLGIDQLLGYGSLSQEMVSFLSDAVKARATILISGGTGTGKTTIINALSQFIPDDEHVITIEDAYELSLSNSLVQSLQTKEQASGDDTNTVSQAELLVATLRMRPDRIVVGEIREKDGAAAMLQAASTGHDGTMSTIHANSAETALNERLSDLHRASTGTPDDIAKRTVAGAINLAIHITRRANRRFISEISVIDRTSLTGSTIKPEPIYTGTLSEGGTPQFRRVGHVRPDTELGVKLQDANLTRHLEGNHR